MTIACKHQCYTASNSASEYIILDVARHLRIVNEKGNTQVGQVEGLAGKFPSSLYGQNALYAYLFRSFLKHDNNTKLVRSQLTGKHANLNLNHVCCVVTEEENVQRPEQEQFLDNIVDDEVRDSVKRFLVPNNRLQIGAEIGKGLQSIHFAYVSYFDHCLCALSTRVDTARNFIHCGMSTVIRWILPTDVSRRITLASSIMSFLDCIWKERRLPLPIKIRVYLAVVQSVLFYASETWTLTSADAKSLEAFHMKCQRRILRMSWRQFVRNSEISALTGLPAINDVIRHRHIAVFGHIARLQDSTPAQSITASRQPLTRSSSPSLLELSA